jgi:hypothetical protein
VQPVTGSGSGSGSGGGDVCQNARIARVWIFDGSVGAHCPNRVHMVYGTTNEIEDTCRGIGATTGIITFAQEQAATFSCIEDFAELRQDYRTYDAQNQLCDIGYRCSFPD